MGSELSCTLGKRDGGGGGERGGESENIGKREDTGARSDYQVKGQVSRNYK